MFTGIVAETGEVLGREATDDGLRLRIGGDGTVGDLRRGQSVSVSGVCLTVERFEAGEWFEVFLAEETRERTYLGDLRTGDPVNLELALRADDRLDGHFVQGHVDGVAEVTGIESVEEDWYFSVSLPEDLAPYVVEKGSIAVDGISLTVAERHEGAFTVAIVPETYAVTTLSAKDVGDPVHLEVDVIAKYVESLTEGY